MPDRSVILARPWSIDQRTTVGHSRPRSIGAQLLEWPTLLDNIWQMFRYVAFGILQFSPVMLARRCQFFVFEVQYRWPALPPPSVLVANIYATKPSCSHRRRHHQQHHLAVVAEMSRTIWYQTLFLPGGTCVSRWYRERWVSSLLKPSKGGGTVQVRPLARKVYLANWALRLARVGGNGWRSS